jgi:sigma-B regulation protein RsbU (phosphoserine phosphatase)
MKERLKPEINRKRKNRLFKICVTVLTGYIITQIATLSAKILNLSSIRYSEIINLYLIVISFTLLFILLVHFKDEITEKFIMFIYFLQLGLFFVMYTFWVYSLHEIRIIGLIFALVALTFVFSFSRFWQTAVLSIGASIIQVVVTYYAIVHGGQSGFLKHEFFVIACFLPLFPAILFISRKANQKQETVKSAKKTLEEMNRDLLQVNSKLETFHESAVVDMELASNVQSTIFPGIPDNTSGWDIALTFKPLMGLSGDFYDFYYSGEKLSGLSLFDVSGHGVSSGLITMFAKPIIYRLFNKMNSIQLGAVMGRANEMMYDEIGDLDNYITGLILRFSGNKIEYANAGHPDLLYKKNGNSSIKIMATDNDSVKGKPLGIFNKGVYYSTVKFDIEKDDVLLAYSDCLIESMNTRGEFYGLNRLINSLNNIKGGTSHEIMDHILKSFYSFIDRDSINDDLSIIVARKLE